MSRPVQTAAWRLPRWRAEDAALWAIALGHAGTHWYVGAFTIILPYFQKDLGLSTAELGLLIGLRSITSAIVNLPAGTMVDVIGRRGLVMAVALAWCGLPYFVLSLSDNLMVIALALAFVGIGNNLWHPAALSTLSEEYATRRGFALAVHSMGANLGDALAPAVVGLLLEHWNWRQVVIANVVPGLCLALVIWLVLRSAWRVAPSLRRQHVGMATYLRGLGELAHNAQLRLLALVAGMRSLTQSALLFALPLYLANNLGLPPSLVGANLALLQAAGVVASPLSGAASDRLGRKRVAMAGMTGTTVLVLAISVFNNGPLFAAMLGLLGFFLFALSPVLFAWSMESTPPEMGGTTVGVLFGTQALFGVFAPVIGGWLADQYGMVSVFYFIAASVLVGNLLTILIPDSRPVPRERP